jgi:hypothetical protein
MTGRGLAGNHDVSEGPTLRPTTPFPIVSRTVRGAHKVEEGCSPGGNPLLHLVQPITVAIWRTDNARM